MTPQLACLRLRPRRVLFATESGGRLFAPDVWALIRHRAKGAGLPAEPAVADRLQRRVRPSVILRLRGRVIQEAR